MKTEALEVMKNRRSIRAYKPEQISAEELDLVLEAGTFAPNGGGTQGFVIVAVQDPATVAKLNELNAKVLAKMTDKDPSEFTPYYGAPTVLLVFATEESSTPVQDGSSVTCNLVNAAYAVGLGTCWVHRAKEIFESSEGKALLQAWGLPENVQGITSVALGYPAGDYPVAPPRKDGLILKV